ncbi:Panacea domain-containing protein [Niallia circulans]|uniref:Panacea domain-containing protein n=1 Tax=Niallia circulans TaxID=1397 RepID=UPI003D983E73
MIEHFIILYSDYKSGRRMAFHKSDLSVSGIFEVIGLMEQLKVDFKHLSFGFHHLQTAEHSWDSVIKYDKFFIDVTPFEDIETFKHYISDDSKITALDVANLMTTKLKITHLKLQKLLYLFYCNFVKKHGRKPFEEDFLAWPYGPVIREVYDKYKVYGKQQIDREDDSQTIDKETAFKLSVFSRFMKTPQHQEVIETLDETISKFGDLDAFELVEITHEPSGPWDIIYREGIGKDDKIPHKLIEESCHN